MIYIGYYFIVNPLKPGVEILIAELGAVGFESFVETDTGLSAFIQKSDWFDDILLQVRILNSPEFEIGYKFNEIEPTNWNKEWESNFEPIIVDDVCMIRAPFHDSRHLNFDIVIEPKMSFGTGHHETTHMMVQHILKNNFSDKYVLDMGCGTGVLAILAELKGATGIHAIDIDRWCYINSKENIERNKCSHITVFEGDSNLLCQTKYDIIIANINRNILLQDIAKYVQCLSDNGMLFLSGYYAQDKDIIESECRNNRLQLVETLERNKWVSQKFLN
jgi:ribosomal protein L11 methyltransferase